MTTAYQIRPAVMTDIERVVELDRRIEHLPHWATADYLAALTSSEGASDHDGTRRCFFVASVGDEIVGVAVGLVREIGAEILAELESVGVADAARRKEVGRELCRVVIEWARQQGAQGIELEVRSRSDGAIALYGGLGFAVAGIRKRYYGAPDDDAVLMRRALGGAGQ